MEPALLPGDRLLVLPAGPGGLPGFRGVPPIGSVVIVAREGRFDVKRVAPPPPGVSGLWLLGDNAALSRDSRQDGPVPLSALRGRVIYRIGPRGRTGRIAAAR
jgi:inner membrane protease subunit 1